MKFRSPLAMNRVDNERAAYRRRQANEECVEVGETFVSSLLDYLICV